MLKSLYSGVSGMKGFQTKLDVIGNNISNVNTVGFKKGRVMFQDLISQNIAGVTAPTAQHGGVNPKQIGLGTGVGAIDTVFSSGSPMTTNLGSDLAISGDAFFVVKPVPNGTDYYLTKAGNFNLDANGMLVNSNGYSVTGLDGANNQVPIVIDKDSFDSYSIDSNGYINVTDKNGVSGKLAKEPGPNGKYYSFDPDNIDAATGQPIGNPNDVISLATSTVNNPGGLMKVGNTMFKATGNSGPAKLDRIENNHGGQVISGVLEMSNVDLTDEFTEMIVAQRGFQANAKTITTSDTILQEIMDLKR